MLSRIRELEIESIYDMEFYNLISSEMEINQLAEEIDRISNNTKNNGVVLLNGEHNRTVNVTCDALNLNNIVLDSPEDINKEIKNTEMAIRKVYKLRKEYLEAEGARTIGYNGFEITGKLTDKLEIIDGELTYIGNDQNEKRWAQEIGIKFENN